MGGLLGGSAHKAPNSITCDTGVRSFRPAPFGSETVRFWGRCKKIEVSLNISVERHRKRRLAARGVAFDRAPVVGVDQRPMRDSLGSAAARRWEGPLKLPQKAVFLGMIWDVENGSVTLYLWDWRLPDLRK